jgi:hypothetical protein
MQDISFRAFGDELVKIAGLGDFWQRFLDIFRSKDERVQRQVDYLFSPKAGNDKWKKFEQNVRDPSFVKQVANHPDADSKLVLHAQSMHELSHAPTINKIKSSRLPGRTYEIKQLSTGLGCTCPDWRFKGSIAPGYECKHIKAHGVGRVQAPA